MICNFCGLESEAYDSRKICKTCYTMKRRYDGTVKCSTESYEKSIEYVKQINPTYYRKKNFLNMTDEDFEQIDTLEKNKLKKIALASKYPKEIIAKFLQDLEEKAWC